ncbi:PREDICTED: aspartic proteinase-like protein 2 isoform X2 [Ipomoea nil]|uniref:aspartic proteinase-like protein 2 isoform X2 n=1 Tax=Ipomoea nil TaxID=35883 RepID=UPI0009014993|nr:PREDICTED: aspartic proteinase-like protein 2 isoform X2 [Ipomoea nil]
MAGVEFLMLLSVMAAAAVALPAVKDASGTFPNGVITLERAFPANEKVEVEVVRARDRLRHARMLQSLSGGIVNFSIAGLADPTFGLYYANVKLGSPPREYNVQFDTGSDLLWLACTSCQGCPRSSGLGVDLNFYDAASSSTASLISCSDHICSSITQTAYAECFSESNQCGYSFQYGDGSGTAGHYVSDVLYFDMVMGNSLVMNSSAQVVFGCSTSQSGSLTNGYRAVDGIFGFGQQGLSVISQLSSLGITPKVFSHCLKGEEMGGGILVLGEILDPRIIYTPLVPSQPHYNLYMQSISVNGRVLPIDPAVFATSGDRGVIVDSGTTLAYLASEAYEPFINAINDLVWQSTSPFVSKEGIKCYVVNASSSSITDIFPPVVLNFDGGATLVLRPRDYLFRYDHLDRNEVWCNGFLKHELTILGDLVLKDKIVVYDIANQRVGWADHDCSTTVNVSITSGKDEFTNAGQLSVNRSPRSAFHKTHILFLMIGFLL